MGESSGVLQREQISFLGESHYLPVEKYPSYYQDVVKFKIQILGEKEFRTIFREHLEYGLWHAIRFMARGLILNDKINHIGVGLLNLKESLSRIKNGTITCQISNVEDLIIELHDMIKNSKSTSTDSPTRKKRQAPKRPHPDPPPSNIPDKRDRQAYPVYKMRQIMETIFDNGLENPPTLYNDRPRTEQLKLSISVYMGIKKLKREQLFRIGKVGKLELKKYRNKVLNKKVRQGIARLLGMEGMPDSTYDRYIEQSSIGLANFMDGSNLRLPSGNTVNPSTSDDDNDNNDGLVGIDNLEDESDQNIPEGEEEFNYSDYDNELDDPTYQPNLDPDIDMDSSVDSEFDEDSSDNENDTEDQERNPIPDNDRDHTNPTPVTNPTTETTVSNVNPNTPNTPVPDPIHVTNSIP